MEPGSDTDLCSVEPGFDINLYVRVDLRTMTEIWLGLTTVERACAQRSLKLVGEPRVERAMQSWLGLSPFAGLEKRAR